MKLPRLTVRRLMILVALGAALLNCGRLVQLSWKYQQKAQTYRLYGRWPGPVSDETRTHRSRQVAWANDLTRKYDQAARSPWLMVEPDPPEPE